MQHCIIIRGVSGTGKSEFVKTLQSLNKDISRVSADDFFVTEDGRYEFDAALLGQAHDKCYNDFCKYILEGKSVIVDNTNTTESQFQRYQEFAESHDIKVNIVVIDPVSAFQKSVHDVPGFALQKQSDQLIGSLTKRINKHIFK